MGLETEIGLDFLSESQILNDPKNLEFYGKDWLSLFKANPSLIVFPKTTKQVVQLVHWARKHKTALVPSGGRTGLSGGATALNKEVIVSFDKMNQLIQFNPLETTLQVQPGMITKELQNKAEEQNLFFPISFSAEGSSQIGGNIASNAGGLHVIQYGPMRRWVRGLEVVTGCGEVLQLGRGLIKNATGYDLLDLFIGSEGTLGFITQAEILLSTKPPPLSVLFLGVQDLKALTEVYFRFKQNLSLYAFEMMTDAALKHVSAMGLQNPLKKSPYYVLMEIPESEQEKSLHIFEELSGEQKIEDGTMSQSFEQARELWALRENISESIAKYSPYKNDISVRISKLADFLNTTDELLKKEYPEYEVVWFGHIGDGNLHINILKPDNVSQEEFTRNCESASRILFSKIKEFQGAVSAEHGVGLLKKNHLHYSRSSEEIEYMKKIKKIFDPDSIINPGKIFDL